MKSPDLESKKIFLIASNNTERIDQFRKWIETQVPEATIFVASDGQEALFKLTNVQAHVALLDTKLEKIDGYEATQKILDNKKTQDVAVIIVSAIPDTEHFVDEVVVSRVQFLHKSDEQREFSRCVARALNRVALHGKGSYRLRFLSTGDVLFKENEEADSVYFVKKGTLEATKTNENGPVSLGKAGMGEFVGEMAHFNSAPRSATVTALDESELIEIPFGVLDMVLFSKPAWAKALMATLSRRLKNSNEAIVTAT